MKKLQINEKHKCAESTKKCCKCNLQLASCILYLFSCLLLIILPPIFFGKTGVGYLFSQSLTPSLTPKVISSAGTYSEAGNVSLSRTIGECAVQTYIQEGIVLNNGFQQGCDIRILFESNNITCYNNSTGWAKAVAYGGIPPYTFKWNTGDTTSNIQHLTPNIYTVTVTDATGCVAVGSVQISGPPPITATIVSTGPSCYGGSDGTALASASGGTPPYSYMWYTYPPQNTQTATGLMAETYLLYITDSNNCVSDTNITITEASEVTINISPTNATCGNSNGSAMVVATGGSGNYTYEWNTIPPQFTPTATGLLAGTYTVKVIDGNGCVKTAPVLISDINGPTVTVQSTSNTGCSSVCTGSADIMVIGGTPPYTYLWSNGGTSQIGANLCYGENIVVVTDANGCKAPATVNIGTSGQNPKISGVITYQGSPVINGYVKLLEYENGQQAVIQDMVNIYGNGSYEFTNVPVADYIVWAWAIGPQYAHTLRTYYVQAEKWWDAQVITADCDNVINSIDISIINLQPIEDGNGHISGYVYEGGGKGCKAEGEPIEDLDITLEHIPGGIIAQGFTDPIGYYEFTNLPVGTYNIYVDIPGLPMGSVCTVSITEDDTLFTINFLVDLIHNYICQDTTYIAEMPPNDYGINIYPNPHRGKFYLEYTKPDYLADEKLIKIELQNITGQPLYTDRINKIIKSYKTQINIPEDVKGVYMVQIITDKRVVNKKVVND